MYGWTDPMPEDELRKHGETKRRNIAMNMIKTGKYSVSEISARVMLPMESIEELKSQFLEETKLRG